MTQFQYLTTNVLHPQSSILRSINFKRFIDFIITPVTFRISQGIVQFGFLIVLVLVKIFSGVEAEVKLIAAGAISNFVSCFILAFAASDWMIYFGQLLPWTYESLI